MKAIMCVEKIVKHGSDIVGNGCINDLRKLKNWNTKARRQRMFEKVKKGPERFISNYNWMLNEIGEKESHKAIKAAICKLFTRPTLSQVSVFEKETGNRRSSDPKGKDCHKNNFLIIIIELQDDMEEESESEFGNITFSELNTVTRSMNDSLESQKEDWEKEKEQLLEKIKRLELRIEKFEEKEKRCAPLLNMYKREKVVKNGSGAYQINPEVNRLSIILER